MLERKEGGSVCVCVLVWGSWNFKWPSDVSWLFLLGLVGKVARQRERRAETEKDDEEEEEGRC